MLAPGYQGCNIKLKRKIRRQYKKQVFAWAKQHIQDRCDLNSKITKENYRPVYRRVLFDPAYMWPVANDRSLLDKKEADGTPRYLPSEVMAINIYLTYMSYGIPEREIYKDLLYAKEQHISEVAARGTRKYPSWYNHKKKKGLIF